MFNHVNTSKLEILFLEKNMEILLNYIIPVFGFVLALIGAWDKLIIGLKYYNHRRIDRLLKKANLDLERIEKYQASSVHLIAYEFKQLFSLVTVVFFYFSDGCCSPRKIIRY